MKPDLISIFVGKILSNPLVSATWETALHQGPRKHRDRCAGARAGRARPAAVSLQRARQSLRVCRCSMRQAHGLRKMSLQMDSKGGFHKWRYPHMDGLYWKIPLKWMIWGYPYPLHPQIRKYHQVWPGPRSRIRWVKLKQLTTGGPTL